MRHLGAGLLGLACAAGAARGQALTPVGTGGVAALTSALRQLGADKRVLMIGAHPDDENNLLLTLLSRGYGVQAAYLSLSRGEGGQNLLGPELGADLGIIRTEELLAARQLDGAGQFFTRAYDFGYSKSADESFRFWPRDSLLPDVIAVIRRFRPQIIISIFTGTPRDGHGQHQVAGQLAREAFEILKDSAWGPVKLYRSAGFDTTGTTVRMPAGLLDPVAGQSYAQIAAASRSRHRSQDQGQLQRPGPSMARLALLETRGAGGGAAPHRRTAAMTTGCSQASTPCCMGRRRSSPSSTRHGRVSIPGPRRRSCPTWPGPLACWGGGGRPGTRASVRCSSARSPQRRASRWTASRMTAS